MTPVSVLIYVFYIIASLTVIGMMFDSNPIAPILEVFRCSALAFLSRSLGSPAWSTGLQVFYVTSAMFWCLYSLKLFEVKKKEKKN